MPPRPQPRQNPRGVDNLIRAARALCRAVEKLSFAPPVSVVYNPLSYAWPGHEAYLRAFGDGPRRVLFLGMNPGPFGMVQTGVPFGEVAMVRDWLKLDAEIARPAREHPRRPILGFRCPRSEISGRRIWGLFASRFKTPGRFFAEHLVVNYCPLAFVETSGRNRTPDKLPPRERSALFAACDRHLREAVRLLQPEWVIGVGDFAFKRAQECLAGSHLKLGRILHPSPASPAANRDWAGAATRQLEQLGVWSHTAAR